MLSGRALFIYNPTLFVDDEGAAGNAEYEVVDEEEEGEKKEEVTIAAAAEQAAEQAGADDNEEVKISLTVFEDEDLGDLPSEEEEEDNTN